MDKFLRFICLCSALTLMQLGVMALVSGISLAQNDRGTSSGPVQAKGYPHPDQYLTVPGVKIADNLEPVIPHPSRTRPFGKNWLRWKKSSVKNPTSWFLFLMTWAGWMWALTAAA